MTTKPAAVKSVTESPKPTAAPFSKPEKTAKKVKVEPGLKHHIEAAERLEDLLGSTMSDEAKAILAPFAKTVRNRMKRWAKVTVVYSDEA